MQNIQIKKRRGRPSKVQNVTYVPSIIDFKDIVSLDQLNIDPKMMETMVSGLNVDKLMSHEGGIPAATNIMMIGDPGVGKTTVLLDVMASVQNKGAKCLFISGEMGKKQMFKYTERFKQFGVIETLFMQDYLEYNTKDVIEQVLNMGYDLVLIDSAAEIIDGVTVNRHVDEITGLTNMIILDPKQRPSSAKDMRPVVKLVDAKGKELKIPGTDIPAHYPLPPKTVIIITDGKEVKVGDVIARLPQESSKTRDITGGLPRVADLFEARKPKEPAILRPKLALVNHFCE